MFDRFSDRARTAMMNARKAAQSMRHDHIGPEHILLGLIDEGHGVGQTVLRRQVDLAQVRDRIETSIATCDEAPLERKQFPFTADAKQALEFTLEEALALGHDPIGTGHLLLGILRVPSCCAARVLVDHGVDLELVRRDVLAIDSPPPK